MSSEREALPDLESGPEIQLDTVSPKTQERDRLSHAYDAAGVGYVPLHLQWQHLNFSVLVGKNKEKKQILFDVSGEAKPGEVIAIMGSSGAGKTTLLNVLAGRGQADGILEGKVLVNGAKRTRNFRRQAAFVEQSDLLFPNLTVQETFDFTAALRLPATLPETAKTRVVEEVISELGLENCRNTRIGMPGVPGGVSGGEKRRVSMGVELITHPNLIFLDEPTSGLDSTTAYRVVSTIKKLAMKGRTVILTIHQPKAKIFEMFDKVFLLAQGKTVFFGSPKQALRFFGDNDLQCPALTNPADFFLDITTFDGEEGDSKQKTQELIDRLTSNFKNYEASNWQQLSPYSHNTKQPSTFSIEAEDANGEQKTGTSHKDLLKRGSSTLGSTGALVLDPDYHFVNSWWHETSVLFRRNLKNFTREKMATVVQLFQAIFMGLVIGGIFFDLGTSQTSVQNRQGVLFFITINQCFGIVFATVLVFTAEKPIFRKERQSGSYRVSSYFLAKNLSEFPIQIVPPFIFTVICYFMVGLRPDADKFFTFVALILLVNFTSQSLGLMIAAWAPNFQAANAISPLIIVIFMLFGGLFLNSSDVPDVLIWLKWLSYINYAYRSFSQNEFTGLKFKSCDLSEGGRCYKTGEEVLDFLDLKSPSIEACVGILLSMGFFYRYCAYLILRFKNKPKLVL